jgi:hypothetical protein
MSQVFVILGPSACGKTFRTCQILRLKDEIIENGEHIKNVIFCYAAWQPVYQQLQDENIVTQWVNKMPTNEEFIDMVKPFANKGGSICVIDDFMSQLDKELDEIVRVSSRHYKTTTFILFQSLFPVQKMARNISLNVKFIHAHKNPRENSQIQYLARQIMPVGYKWLVQAYHKATEEPYSSFLFDLTQEREPHLRFRSHYLPYEFPMRVYFQKGDPAFKR